MTKLRIGHGYDVHRLAAGRSLILGGVTIPYDRGLDGHSDADVLTHAVMDALLGAAAMGDIGKLFPDTDDRYLGADSMELLRRTQRGKGQTGQPLSCMAHTHRVHSSGGSFSFAPEIFRASSRRGSRLRFMVRCPPSRG